MKISAVVPAYNEEKLLRTTLRSIQAAAESIEKRGWAFELVVCDNNSTDRTADIAREEGALVVFEPVNQISRARNAGAGAATGDWIIFVDADSEVSPELFDDVCGAIHSGRYIAGGVTVLSKGAPLAFQFSVRLWNLISRMKKWCAGAFIFCERAAFQAVGGFSPELFVSEELDLSHRLKAYGRARGRKLVILSAHPLQTSHRKLGLYGYRTHLRFLWTVILGRKRVLGNREECGIWYDGRR